jgi:hypothetical protein
MNIESKDINEQEKEEVFSNLRYICESTGLIVEALQKGLDVAQMPNGDVIITEVKTVNTQYTWSNERQKMVRVGYGSSN